MENKTLILTVVLLTGLAISAGDVSAAGPSGKVSTHVGTLPMNKIGAANNWAESQVKGYIGKGKVVTGLKANGEPVLGGVCKNPYTCE